MSCKKNEWHFSSKDTLRERPPSNKTQAPTKSMNICTCGHLVHQINSLNRHFRPKLVNWNESVYCTQIDRALKMWFNKGSGSFLLPTIPELWWFLWNQFFGQYKHTNIRFSTIFLHKTRIFSLQKVQKIQFWLKWLNKIYLTKAKSRAISLFI